MKTITEIAQEFLDLRDRKINPPGEFDKQGRFYIEGREKFPCCRSVRSPSANWPYSEMVHGRTAKHLAHVYDVSETDIKREARRIEKQK